MIILIEKFLLSILQAFFGLPLLVGGVALGSIALALLITQFRKGKQWYNVPGILSVATVIILLIYIFNRDGILAWIDLQFASFRRPDFNYGPAPFIEPLFLFFVGPYAERSLVEEMLGFALGGYLGWVVYFTICDVRRLGFRSVFSLPDFSTSRFSRPLRSSSNELGSGDLANRDDILHWTKPNDPELDTVFPVSDLRGSEGIIVRSGNLVIPSDERNRHILAVAKTGSGKTTKLILPILYNDCLSKIRSTVVIDSKPEMWRKLAMMTRHYNPEKNIMLFNPLDRARSLSWNILGKIENDTDAKLIANTIVMATDNPMAKADSPFFRNNALQILNAIMVGLLHDENDTLSMPRVHELVQSGMKSLADWLEQHPDAIRITRTFVELARSGSQNADTIMSELSMRLSAWDLQAIRATTAFSELDLEKLILEPSLFIIELRESELEMLRPMANVIVVEILRYLTKYAEHCPKTKLPRPVGLVIDEFASALGRLPDIHIKLNTLRSRNVSIVGAIQSTAQIKANYNDDADSVLAGFSTKIFMPSLDLADAEWASKETGQMTIRFNTASTGSNRKIIEWFASKNDSTQEQVQQRAVLTPDEIGRPADNACTFFMPNSPVFQGHLTPYYKMPTMLKHIDEFDSEELELKLRAGPIEYKEEAPKVESSSGGGGGGASNALPAGISNTAGWDDEKVLAKLNEVKTSKLDWENTTGSARKWWEAFENENKHRNALVLRLAEELAVREATITEFFLAYVYSNTDNIQANLHYLDYTRLKKEEERRKREASESSGQEAAA